MTGALKAIALALLWAIWAYSFIQIALIGYAFTGSILKSITPGPPLTDYGIEGFLEWAGAVALLYGMPVALGILSWRFLKSRSAAIRIDQ